MSGRGTRPDPLHPYLGLRCTRCAAEYEHGELFEGCPACRDGAWAANLEAAYDYALAIRHWRRLSGRGVWRYRSLLPVREPHLPTSLGEGGTPLVEVRGLGGLQRVWVKNESTNPTWSYKDRLSAVTVSIARGFKAATVGISSTGNLGASASAYAARAGLSAVVLTRDDIRDPDLAFMQVYGGLVLRTTRYGRWDLLRHGVMTRGWYPISSYTSVPTGNPFGIEGYKTIAYEIVEELGVLPDFVVVPSATGEGLAGITAGFRDLEQMKVTDRLPRMVAAEPAGGAPLARTLEASEERGKKVAPFKTIATTLGATVAIDRALLAITTTFGGAIPVTDEALRAAQAALLQDGLFAEPSGAAAAAALPRLAETFSGFDPRTSVVVVVMTGGGLRTLGSARRGLPLPPMVEPMPEALDELLDSTCTSASHDRPR